MDGIITYLLTKALPWKYWSLVTRSQVIEKVNVTRCCQAWYLANLLKIKNFGERKTLLRDGNSITYFTATRTKSMLPRTVVKVIQYSNVSTTRPGTKIFTLSEIREPSPARLYLQPVSFPTATSRKEESRHTRKLERYTEKTSRAP